MSAAKRLRQRPEDATHSASPQSANKRLKTTKSPHVPAVKSGLDFLLDENARDGKKLGAKLTNGAPIKNTTRIDEVNAIVAPKTTNAEEKTQPDVVDISSGEEESSELDESEDETTAGAQSAATTNVRKPSINGHISLVSNEQKVSGGKGIVEGSAGNEDVEMGGMAEDASEAGDDPSLGDMLLARHPGPINVADSFQDPLADSQAMVPSAGKALSVPSGNSLGTVLAQALRTNDKDLLESCFQTSDKTSIRATVQRLPAQHVTTLLTRLAERIHKRPGRTGNLLVWIQWCLVAHGGYLSSQSDVMRQLASLQSVIRERANGLQPLLHVKGKLDMLSAQLELRRDLQQSSRALNGMDDEEDDAVIYVEGQDDDWSSSEGEDQDDDAGARMIGAPSMAKKGKKPAPRVSGHASASEGSDDDQIPTTNGVSHLEDDEESGSDEEGQDGMLDAEAEETDDDDAEEASEDGEASEGASEDEDMSEDESEEEARPVRSAKLNRKR